MFMQYRDAQLAQNMKDYEEWADMLIEDWGRQANFGMWEIREWMDQINVNKKVRGVYAALKTKLQREPDRRSNRQIADQWAKTCRLKARKQNEPCLVLKCLEAMHQGLRPWMSIKDIAWYVDRSVNSKTVKEIRRIMHEQRINEFGDQAYTLFEYAKYYDPRCTGYNNIWIRDIWISSTLHV